MAVAKVFDATLGLPASNPDAWVPVSGTVVTAAAVSFTPAGGVGSTNMQAAIVEVMAAIAANDADDIGKVYDFAGPASKIPARHLACFGQAVSRTTYAAAFAVLCPRVSVGDEVTLNAAADTVQFVTSHGLAIGDPIFFSATVGGITAETLYYVRTVPSSTTITLTTTRTVAAATGALTMGAALNVTGTGIFVTTARVAPWGISGSTTFNMPDLREVATVGKGDMGGTDRGISGFAWANVLGLQAGEATHLLTTAEAAQKSVGTGTVSADHGHSLYGSNGGTSGFTFSITNNTNNDFAFAGSGLMNGARTGGINTNHSHNITGSDASTAHNNVQPSAMVNKIMYVGV